MTPATGSADLDGMLKRLHLPTIRRLYPELALRAEGEQMSYRDFLEILACRAAMRSSNHGCCVLQTCGCSSRSTAAG